MKRSFFVVLVVLALLATGCGGSGATPRTAAGVREDYRSFVQLLAAGEGKRACEQYVSAAFKAALAAQKRGSCPSFFESAWAKGSHTVKGTTAALKAVRVNGNRATISTKKGSRAMLYSAGHWQDAPLYTVTVTEPNGGATFAIARNPDGSITRSCHPAGVGGCSQTGAW